jgi:hypothetical protein
LKTALRRLQREIGGDPFADEDTAEESLRIMEEDFVVFLDVAAIADAATRCRDREDENGNAYSDDENAACDHGWIIWNQVPEIVLAPPFPPPVPTTTLAIIIATSATTITIAITTTTTTTTTTVAP